MTPVSSGLPSCSPDQRCTSTLGSPQTHHVATLPHSAPSQWVHPMGVTGLAVARLWVHLHLQEAQTGCTAALPLVPLGLRGDRGQLSLL